MVGSSAEDATRLDFSHGHLAGQTGLAFALEEHKKERNIKKEGESERERKGGGGGGGTKTKTTLITGGADCLTCLRTEESGFKNTDTEINDHEEVITCLAANAIASSSSSSSSSSANGRKGLQRRTDLFATGSEDRFVKLYSFPDAVFETNATRFELPVRALDFAPEGRTLACGGDDEGIRIVEIDYEDDKSCKVLRTLRTAGRSIKSIRWDPEGAFVAAVSADGTLQIWKAESGEVALTKRGVAHRFDKSSPNCAHISWQHEGIFLAVPGTSGDVLFLERLSWEEEFSLPSAADGEKLGHTGAVTCVELSPNGLYAATSGLDRRIVVWNVKDQKPIATRASDAVVCNMRWHPNQNALSLMDEEGNVGHWESPVDTSLPDPAFVEDEEEDTVPVREASEAFPADKGEKKKKMTIVESDSEESEDILGAAAAEVAVTGREQHTLRIAPPKLQKAFQPGATPLAPNSQRRFLAYNMDGYISTMRGSDFSSIEVVFHDVSSRSSRIPTLTDYYGFEMGALGPRGTILASPERGPESPSVLMYRPFESWAVGSEWTCTFPSGEEVKAVTVGTSFAAAATMNFLRVYSLAGSPRMILSIPGPVVALAANESWLALIYHEAGPVLDGNGSCSQKLAFHLYDVSSENQIASGPLCLSPGSELEWVGFSEEGIFTTCDNQGCIRGYFESYGGSWVPLFSSKDSRKAETEHHYIVGLSQKEVFCVITKSANHFPQVVPRPIITNMPLQIPIVCDDPGSKVLQDSYMQTKLRHHQIQCSHAATSQLMPLETQMDKTLMKLIHAAIKGDQLEKGFELASCLNLQRSLQGALKLANVMRKRVLAEKITTLIQNREALIQVQHEMPVHNHSQVSELQSPVGMEAGNTKSRDSALVKVKEEKENVFSRKRSASEMAAPKTPKNPFARS